MALNFRESIMTRAVLGAAVLVVLCMGVYVAFDGIMMRGMPVRRAGRTVDLTYSFTIGDLPTDAKTVLAWVPLPPSNDNQKLIGFEVESDTPYRIVAEQKYGNRFVLLDIGEQTDQTLSAPEISIRFHVTRHATNPLRRPTSPEPFTEAQLWQHLKPDRLIPTDGKIAAEAREVAGGFSNPLMLSRLLYDHIVETVSYDKSGTGWGRGDAIYACDIRKGNCTDFHSLYIAEARSLGIPARFIMGLSLDKDKNAGQIDGYHCWAEFYVTEKGWLPIDASEAHRNPEKKEDFYGGLDEHRIAFSIGRDIQLPGSASGPVNFAIYPHVEVDGQEYDNVETILSFTDCDD